MHHQRWHCFDCVAHGRRGGMRAARKWLQHVYLFICMLVPLAALLLLHVVSVCVCRQCAYDSRHYSHHITTIYLVFVVANCRFQRSTLYQIFESGLTVHFQKVDVLRTISCNFQRANFLCIAILKCHLVGSLFLCSLCFIHFKYSFWCGAHTQRVFSVQKTKCAQFHRNYNQWARVCVCVCTEIVGLFRFYNFPFALIRYGI